MAWRFDSSLTDQVTRPSSRTDQLPGSGFCRRVSEVRLLSSTLSGEALAHVSQVREVVRKTIVARFDSEMRLDWLG